MRGCPSTRPKKTTLAFWERTGQLIKRSFKENKSKPTLPNVCSRFLRAAAVYFARSRPSAPFGGRGCFGPLTVQRARTLRRLQANIRRPCVLGMLVTAHGAHFGAPGGLFSRLSSFSFCPSPAVVFFPASTRWRPAKKLSLLNRTGLAKYVQGYLLNLPGLRLRVYFAAKTWQTQRNEQNKNNGRRRRRSRPPGRRAGG